MASGSRAAEPDTVTKDVETPRDTPSDRAAARPSEAELRRRRLASALRENLKRRKEQSRSRRVQDPA